MRSDAGKPHHDAGKGLLGLGLLQCAPNNLPTTKPTVPFVSVNGHNPFPVGYNSTTSSWQTGNNAWVAVDRQLVTYDMERVMVVMVAFQATGNNVYAQGFLVDPSTGAVVGTPGNPVRVNLPQMKNYSIQLGGIAGDDNGNFVVSYTRQEGSSGTTGVFVAGFNYASSTFGFQEFSVSSFPGSQYAWSRVACYHSGGFVVGYNDMSAARYTTNWTSSPTLASRTNYYNNHGLRQNEPQTAQWGIACERDTPGNYILTWVSQFSSGGEFQTQCNVVIGQVTGNALNAMQYITDYVGNEHQSPSNWGLTPSVAICDLSYGGVFQVDFCLAASGGTTGTITAAHAPLSP